MSFKANLKYFNVNLSFCKKRKRKSRKRKSSKHIYSFFITRKKKYDLYFIPFDQKTIDKNRKSVFFKNCKNRIGLKSLKLDLIKVECLKSLKFCNQRFLKSVYLEKNFKEIIHTIPDYFLTAKPKSIRMGKGKGEAKFKVYFLKKNNFIFSLKFIFSIFKTFFVNRKLEMFKINIFVFFLMNVLSNKLSVETKKFKYIL